MNVMFQTSSAHISVFVRDCSIHTYLLLPQLYLILCTKAVHILPVEIHCSVATQPLRYSFNVWWNSMLLVIRKCPLSKATEERQLQSEAMNITPETEPTVNETIIDSNKEPLIYKSLSRGPELWKHTEKSTDFINKLKRGYTHDPLLSKVIKEPDHYKTFRCCDDLVYSTNCGGNEVLCIPYHITKKYSLTAINIKQVHTVLGHFRSQKTGNHIHCWYWWLKMQQEVDKFCYSCSNCQANKTSM